MEETWDEVSWQEDNELKEWYVEYSAQVNDEKIPHMIIVRFDTSTSPSWYDKKKSINKTIYRNTNIEK